MKALSLKQPWAELILQKKKVIETRKWNTNFRGTFYIHTSRNIDAEKAKLTGLENLNIGCIIGKADLVDVKEYKDEKDFQKDNDLHQAGELRYRKYGFILKNIKRIKPIPCKGRLNFFEVKI